MLKSSLITISFLTVLAGCSTQNELSRFQDSDLDGVHNRKDACPKKPGSVFNLGCPQETSLSWDYNKKMSTDSDLDGVPDEKDECPELYGSPFNQGCPFKN